MPFGARIEDGGVRFRLWAPDLPDASIPPILHVPEQGDIPMAARAEGWFEAFAPGLGAGARYGFRVGDLLVPDPASRHQPGDVHGTSEVVDPEAYDWRDGAAWHGRPWETAVLYELHVGTFTPEGTFRAAIGRLADLADLGVTAVELMPVAEFPGRRGWGYDGVQIFAPDAAYGRPEDLKALVDEAHRLGLMVLLDVVYNHFGPEGNYLHIYARRFFTDHHHTPWGQAINYESADARPVRDFVLHNALYWLREFNVDGLRFDAVHAIHDDSRPHILEDLALRIRAEVAETEPDRIVHLIVENDANSASLLRRDDHKRPLLYTAQWNDDFHHAMHRVLTGEAEGYYRDYGPHPIDHLRRCLEQGFAYQGERSRHRQGASRGEISAHLPPQAFVTFLQNHDQTGNRALGERLDALAPRVAVEAALALMLLAPFPPMLFMGEEWGEANPFLYFCDLEPRLGDAVRRGRRREFAAFLRAHGGGTIPDPLAEETFARSRLDWARRNDGQFARRRLLVQRLLTLRHGEVVPRLVGTSAGRCERIGPCSLRCAWGMGDGARLTARANFSASPVGDLVPESGRLLYPFQEDAPRDEAVLPPWSVDWHISNDGGAVRSE